MKYIFPCCTFYKALRKTSSKLKITAPESQRKFVKVFILLTLQNFIHFLKPLLFSKNTVLSAMFCLPLFTTHLKPNKQIKNKNTASFYCTR